MRQGRRFDQTFDEWLADSDVAKRYQTGDVGVKGLVLKYEQDTGQKLTEKAMYSRLEQRGVRKRGIRKGATGEKSKFRLWVEANSALIEQYKKGDITNEDLRKRYIDETESVVDEKKFANTLYGLGIHPPIITPITSSRRPHGYFNIPENVDKEYDDIKSQLGRDPMNTEFNIFSSGALSAINGGRYHKDVHKFEEYLRHRGFWKGKINSAKQLAKLLESEEIAQHAVRLTHGDDAALADVLSVIFAERITREQALEFMEESNVRGKLIGSKPIISDIIESGEHLLHLDKNQVIEDLIIRQLRDYARKTLGPIPTQDQQQDFLEELEREIASLSV